MSYYVTGATKQAIRWNSSNIWFAHGFKPAVGAIVDWLVRARHRSTR